MRPTLTTIFNNEICPPLPKLQSFLPASPSPHAIQNLLLLSVVYSLLCLLFAEVSLHSDVNSPGTCGCSRGRRGWGELRGQHWQTGRLAVPTVVGRTDGQWEAVRLREPSSGLCDDPEGGGVCWGEAQEGGVHGCLGLTQFVAQQKLTQNYKATVLQSKMILYTRWWYAVRGLILLYVCHILIE